MSIETYGYWPCFTENLSDHSKDTLTTQFDKIWVIDIKNFNQNMYFYMRFCQKDRRRRRRRKRSLKKILKFLN